MIDFSIHVEIPDISREEIEIDCPNCKLGNWTTFGSIKRREYIICRGCHSNILLEDNLGSVQRFLTKMKSIFKDFK